MKKTIKHILPLAILVCILAIAFVMTASAEVVTDNGASGDMSWTLNTETGIVEVTPLTAPSSSQKNFEDTAWIAFADTYGSLIKEIHIVNVSETADFTKIEGRFKNIPNLEAFLFDEESSIYTFSASAVGYLFSDNKSLATFGYIGTAEGTCDLSMIESYSATYWAYHAFENTAFTNIIFSTKCPYIGLALFKNCDNLTEINIPANVTTIHNEAFMNCDNLTKVTINAEKVTFNGNPFPAANDNLTLYVIKGSDVEVWAAENGYNIEYITIEGSVDDTNGIKWSLLGDVLTITPADANTTGVAALEGANFVSFLSSYGSKITSIVIKNSDNMEFTKLRGQRVKALANLTSVTFVDSIKGFDSSFQMAENKKLATFGPIGTEAGSCNLSNFVGSYTTSTYYYMFTASAFSSIQFPTSWKYQYLCDYMFSDNDNLTEIVIPANIAYINTNAFSGCDNLKKVVILSANKVFNYGTAFSENADLEVICMQAAYDILSSLHTETKITLISESDIFDSGLAAEGISIRLTGYNGIRYIYSFNNAAMNNMSEKCGLTLKEYGVVMSSEATYTANEGITLTNVDGEYVTGVDKIIKVAVYQGGEYVGKVLADSTANVTMFAGSIVKYSANYRDNVYVGAYTVYVDGAGNEYITFVDYSEINEDYKFCNLYDVTVGMYALNAENITETVVDKLAVWDTLLVGAVENYVEEEIEGFAGSTVTVVEYGDAYLAVARIAEGQDEAAVLAAALTQVSTYTETVVKAIVG